MSLSSKCPSTLSRKAILDLKSSLSLLSELVFPVALHLFFDLEAEVCTALKVRLFQKMLQQYKDRISSALFSVPLLVILDIHIIFLLVLLSTEQMICLFIYYFQVQEEFLIRINLEGAVKVEDGDETVLKTESGTRGRRTGSETENYGQKKVKK